MYIQLISHVEPVWLTHERLCVNQRDRKDPGKEHLYSISCKLELSSTNHDDVIKCKHFPRYWPFVWGIHLSPVISPHKGQWRGALMFSLICALNKRMRKQSWGWWFETPSRSLWRYCNVETNTVALTQLSCLVLWKLNVICYGTLTRYANLRVVPAPGMPGTLSLPPLVSDPDKHHGTCVMHVPWCMPGSLISGSLWSRWRGKGSRHSRRMRNTQFCVSGKRPMIHQ